MGANREHVIHTYPTELLPVCKVRLPAGKTFTEGSLTAFLEETTHRWKRLYKLEPAFRISQLKPTREEPYSRTLLRIWSQVKELPKDELLWLQQETERRYGCTGASMWFSTPLPRSSFDPYTLYLTLNPREVGRLKVRHRSQFIMLPGGYTGIVWQSEYDNGGVFTDRESGEKIFVQYRPDDNEHWPILAGSIYPLLRTGRREEDPPRLKAIGRIRLFERCLVSYQHD